MEAVETIEHRGHTIELHHDQDASSPREDDNLGTMVGWSRQYTIGDDHNFSEPSDFEEWAKEQGDKIVVFPINLYDHSVQHISMSSFIGRAQHAEWDSGQCGYIYMEVDKFIKESSPEGALGAAIHAAQEKASSILRGNNPLTFTAKSKAKLLKSLKNSFKSKSGRVTKALREAIEGYLRWEVETYDLYFSGQVYAYTIEGPHDDDSCCGFYGTECAIEEAKASIDFAMRTFWKKSRRSIKAKHLRKARSDRAHFKATVGQSNGGGL